MIKQLTTTPALLIGIFLLSEGCSLHPNLLKEALQQREEAYIRVAKAITKYCTVTTETLNARDACIVDRRLSLEREHAVPALTIPAFPRSSAMRK